MSLSVDLFWSFRSPYSYLATPRLNALQKEYDFDVNVRIVFPIAVRIEGFFDRVNPLWPPYLMRDTYRTAQYHGLPYGWPQPDPIVQDFSTRQVSKDQPYIYRLCRLGVEATHRGKGMPFITQISRVIFGGDIVGWHEGDHLAKATARAGLDLADLDAAIAKDPASYDKIIDQNQKDLETAGHWGVPTMVFKDEPFFGQDRIDMLMWRMKQHGLVTRG